MSHRLWTAAALVAAAVAFAGPSPAAAHQGAEYTSDIVRVRPELDGLSFAVLLSLEPLLEVTNETDEVLVVLGEDGEPFLRIGDGRVEINRNSPTAHRSEVPVPVDVPDNLDPAADPSWRTVARGDSYRWYDPRIRPPDPPDPQGSDWLVPTLLGSRTVDVVGRIDRVGAHGHFVSGLVERPQSEGLEVRLVPGAIPAYFVRNTSGELLEVPGLDGEPFLRIGPDGVSVNVRSPYYYRAGGQRIREVPPEADPDAEPEWKQEASAPVYGWLEYRARLPDNPVAVGTEERIVLRWSTPVTFGGRGAELAGTVTWVPPGALGPVEDRPWEIPAVVAVVLVVGGVWFALRRRRTAGSDDSA